MRRVVVEEEVAKLGRIEPEHEAAEREVALALTRRESVELTRCEVAALESVVNRLSGFECGLHRHGDARREDRIEEGARVAGDEPAVAGIRARGKRKIFFDSYRPFALARGEQPRHDRRVGDRAFQDLARLESLEFPYCRLRNDDPDTRERLRN